MPTPVAVRLAHHRRDAFSPARTVFRTRSQGCHWPPTASDKFIVSCSARAIGSGTRVSCCSVTRSPDSGVSPMTTPNQRSRSLTTRQQASERFGGQADQGVRRGMQSVLGKAEQPDGPRQRKRSERRERALQREAPQPRRTAQGDQQPPARQRRSPAARIRCRSSGCDGCRAGTGTRDWPQRPSAPPRY
jgi:hypothetical protein